MYDAMYLAGLIADDAKMTRADRQRWLGRVNSPSLFSYTTPWVARREPALAGAGAEWIASDKEDLALAGWSTLGGLVSVKGDAELDLDELSQLLTRVTTTSHDQPDNVRYAMNGFVIAVGAYVKPLTAAAVAAAEKMGTLSVDMGDTPCKVPNAAQYIKKVKQRSSTCKKRQTVKC